MSGGKIHCRFLIGVFFLLTFGVEEVIGAWG